jgi:hypothetical protein
MEQVKGTKMLSNTILGIAIFFGLGAVYLTVYGIYLWSKQNAEDHDKLTHD